MKIKNLAVGALMLGLSSLANAELGYTYVEATHQMYSELDVNMWELKGSYRINDQFFVSMEDSNLLNKRSGSFGVIFPVNELDAYGQFGLGDSVDDAYTIFEAGVRMAVNTEIEVRGAVRIEPEALLGEGETSMIGEGLYHLSDKVALTGGLVLPSEADGNVIRLGARINLK